MQPNSLKALAQAVLERNQQCNQDATTTKKPCNSTTEKAPLQLHQGADGNQLHNPPKVAPELRGDATKKRTEQHIPTKHSCIVALYGDATMQPGVRWCRDHLDILLAGGWTEKELFHPTLPRGLALLEQWSRPGLQVVLDGGLVRFRWTRTDGGQVEQVGRPDAEVTI